MMSDNMKGVLINGGLVLAIIFLFAKVVGWL